VRKLTTPKKANLKFRIMKLIMLLFISFGIPLLVSSQNKSNGKKIIFEGFSQDERFELIRDDSGSNIFIDSITVNNEKYEYFVADTSCRFFKINNASLKINQLFSLASDVTISLDQVSKNVDFKFSKSDSILNSFLKDSRKWIFRSIELNKKIDSIDPVANPAKALPFKLEFNSIPDSIRKDELNFFFQNSTEFCCLYTLKRLLKYEGINVLDSMFSAVTPNLREFSFYKEALKSHEERKEKEKVTMLPRVSLTDFKTGKPIETQFIENRLLLLDFWGTWCKPCIAAFPKLEKLRLKYKKRSLEILGIASEFDANIADFSKTITQLNPKWKISRAYFEDKNNNLPVLLNIQIYPTYLLVGSKGKIVLRTTKFEELEKYLFEYYKPIKK
jgi:thiol-disulfide isomerase/thioredoxin